MIICFIFLITSIATVALFYYHSRQRSATFFDDDQVILKYFIQKQVNYKHELTGYECLLRQQLPDGSWSLPQEADRLPLQRAIILLEDTFNSAPRDNQITLSINLSHSQIMSPDFDYFVRWAISRIQPLQLSIEYHPTRVPISVNQHRFNRKISLAKSYGAQFVIDNVGSDLNDLKNVEWMLPVVDVLKCSMRAFRKTNPSEWLDLNLQFWNQLARDNNIDLVLTGIENKQDEALAEQLKIKFRQGYLFGLPANT